MNSTPLKKIRVRVKRRNDNSVCADNLVTVVIRGQGEFTRGVIVVAADGYELIETGERHRE